MLSTEERIKVWLRKRLPFKFPGRSIFPLFVIRWWLVVLDEAHLVSNLKTKISAAVCALPGLYRLPMTGTPLQNEYTDIQGMLAFMRVKPWSDLNLFKQVCELHWSIRHNLLRNSNSTSSRGGPRISVGIF